MYGLFVLGALVAYIAICYWLVIYTVRKSKNKAALKGILVFLLYNSPLGYEIIPTVIIHSNACESRSGFWLNKTPGQWKQENPGEAEKLHVSKARSFHIQHDDASTTRVYPLNERFEWRANYKNENTRLLKEEQTVVDLKTDEIMARKIDFFTRGVTLFGSAPSSSGCFIKEESGRWGINNEGFTEYKWKFQFLGESK